MNKEFEELKAFLKHHCLTNCGHNANENCICKIALCFKEIENAEQFLTELQAIKEAEPSEAFGNISRGLETIENDLIALAKLGVNETFDDLLLDISKTIQLIKKDLQALLKAQEQEKENESLKADLTIELNNKKNAVEMLKEQVTLREEQDNVLKTIKNIIKFGDDLNSILDFDTYEEYDSWSWDYEMPKKEFDLLKRWYEK